MSDKPTATSILLHVRRTRTEDAYVSVLVTGEVMQATEDGGYKLVPDLLFAKALRVAEDPRVEWRPEDSQITPHDIQQPLPPDRTSFVEFDHLP